MKVPGYVQLFILTLIVALGCADIGGGVANYVSDTPPVRLLIFVIMFVSAHRMLLAWHRKVWEARHAV
jgi:uncharacterized membrane protein YfcA